MMGKQLNGNSNGKKLNEMNDELQKYITVYNNTHKSKTDGSREIHLKYKLLCKYL